MSEYIHKAHNVSVLIYHIVCPAKYRRVVISEEVDNTLRRICEEISKRYEIIFLEIGTEGDHVHYLVQSVPMYSPTKIVRTIKSITAKEIFKKHPEVKEKLWGGEFWSDGHFVSTVGRHGNEETIANYVKAQGTGKDYRQLYKIRDDENQLSLFN
jgi:REP element-mobilizing transposase RayT